MHRTENGVDIHGIFERGGIASFFQPIVSVKKKSVIGFEALSRGIDGAGGLLPPQALFEAALPRAHQGPGPPLPAEGV